MTPLVAYTWIPGVFAAELQPGDRVTEFADNVETVTPSARRPEAVDVTFAESAGVFTFHVLERFTVTRPLSGLGPDDDEDDDGQQHDEAEDGGRW